MKPLNDIRQRNLAGYPRSIYENDGVSIEVWKFGNVSRFALIIPNHILTQKESGVIKAIINGIDYLVLNLPPRVGADIRNTLDGERFQGCVEDDVQRTSDFFVLYLGITLAGDLGKLFDEHHVVYERDIYMESRKAWLQELDRYMDPGED